MDNSHYTRQIPTNLSGHGYPLNASAELRTAIRQAVERAAKNDMRDFQIFYDCTPAFATWLDAVYEQAGSDPTRLSAVAMMEFWSGLYSEGRTPDEVVALLDSEDAE